MEAVFLKILNMSIAACWIIAAAILARFVLAKAPKWIRVVMWGIVGIRLICPFSIESVLSLIPRAETVPSEIIYTDSPIIDTPVEFDAPIVTPPVTPGVPSAVAPAVEESLNPAEIAVMTASIVWLLGLAGLLVYMGISFLMIHKRVSESAFLKDNVWVCDRIDTPFVLGVFRPRIYLPSAMSKEDMEYVIAHEKAHLKRRDNWWKPAGFLVLAVHWFNPLVWLAYILLCRDIEFACDEKVIKALSITDRKAYSNALINCSAPRRVISACPLAFGENGVKSRIKSVLNYKKPAFWIILIAVIACIVVAVCFLTNPKTKPGNDSDNTSSGTGVFTNDPQEFTQAVDKLSMTLTTDKTEYVLGEDKIAEVTATVKNTSSEQLWLTREATGKNSLLVTTLELLGSGISLQDLDGFPAIADAIDYEILDPGEEYVQKMRFDLTGEGYHPLTEELLPPVEPGEYQGKCAGVFHTDSENVKVEECSLDFKIVVKHSPSAVLTNDPQKFSKGFDKLSMTLTTDKTEYVLGVDKIAEVTATVKNTSSEKLWLYYGCTNGENFMLETSLELPGSGISLQDLDYFPAMDEAIEEKLLNPGEEYVQKMRFDLTGEGLHPLMGTLLPPVDPGVYQGKCAGVFHYTDPESVKLEECSLDFKIVVKQSSSAVLTNNPQEFTKAFNKFSVTVTSDKAKYVLGEDKIAQVTAVVKNTSDKSIILWCSDLGQNHMIRTSLKHWISEMNLIDLDCAEVAATAINKIELKPGEEYTQVMRFDLARDEVNQFTNEKLPPAEVGWYFGTCRVRYLENPDDDHTNWNSIDFRIALVKDINDNPGNINASANDKTIFEDDVEAVRANYNGGDKPVYDAKVVDLGFDGREEVLVLTSQGNPKVFEVWDKRGGEMKFVTSFGAGKLNWINKISLLHCIDADERSRYVFTFSYSGENSMTADEVLAEIVRTADGYDIVYLLSRGRIEYTDVPEPFTKEFYRKGWSKYDIGMDAYYGDITKEEYIKTYKDLTGITIEL